MDNIFYAILAFIASGTITWLIGDVIDLRKRVQHLENKVGRF